MFSGGGFWGVERFGLWDAGAGEVCGLGEVVIESGLQCGGVALASGWAFVELFEDDGAGAFEGYVEAGEGAFGGAAFFAE